MFYELISSILLHTLCALTDLRYPSPNNQPMWNRIFLNYSIHIAGTSLIFILTGGCPVIWSFGLALATFYQLLGYFAQAMKPGSLKTKLTSLYMKITNPPYARYVLSLFEIMSMIPTPTGPHGFNKANLLISSTAYILWFILYRYACDDIHRQIWSQMYMQISGLIMKLPAKISGFLIRVLFAPFRNIGIFARRIYSVKTSSTPTRN